MSTFNIATKQISNFNYNPNWNLNLTGKVNQKYSYNFFINRYLDESFVFSLDPISYFNSTIRSSIKSNNLANIWRSSDILLSRLGMPIHNSAPGWRLK